LPQAKRRPDLVAFVRKLKMVRPDVIAEAGLIVTIRNGTKPVIVTDKFIVQFQPWVRESQIDSMNTRNVVQVIERNRMQKNHYLLAVTDSSRGDAITVANLYHASGLVRYAHPNFIRVLGYRQEEPNDSKFGLQWYLENHGQSAGPPGTEGTGDADIDALKAWDILKHVTGAGTVTIAVIDGGFDLTHPDLSENLWVNDGELRGRSGEDDDHNEFTDDVHGYDFLDCDATSAGDTPCGDGDPSYNPAAVSGSDEYVDDLHGTPVAGLVGAVVNNGEGIAGTCPTSRLMLIRRGFDEEHLAQAFYYAQKNGARVISCSWGDDGDGTDTSTLNDAIDEVVAQGSVVLFAMGYAKRRGDCTRDGSWDLAERPSVIAVGGATNWDRKLDDAACGDYVDVLGPTGRGSGESPWEFRGTLDVVTTDIQDVTGYNSHSGWRIAGCPTGTETDDVNYTCCFSGTSAAAPIVAGVAGMLLSVDSGLSPASVQRLLQDTADKIEPGAAAYDPKTGFSHPSGTPSTHGYGRVNAYEAVHLAAPVEAGGRGGVDVFVRDNELDWGNTEQPSYVTFEQTRGYKPFWESPDVKIDAPGYQLTAMPTSAEFDAKLMDENPVAGEVNRVYVRVRNRGPEPASNVTARLYWAYGGTSIPRLPGDFWSAFDSNQADQTDWHFIGEAPAAGEPGVNVAYSGCTETKERRAAGESEAAGIFVFKWPAPNLDPSQPDHCRLLLIVGASGDGAGHGADPPGPYLKYLGTGVPTDDFDLSSLTPSDNNVTQRDYLLVEDSSTPGYHLSFYVANPFLNTARFVLNVGLPPGWIPSIRPPLPPRPGSEFELKPGEKRLVTVDLTPTGPSAAGKGGTVIVTQERVTGATERDRRGRPKQQTEMVGGLTARVGPGRPKPPG
jgi:hypothetical protein